MLTFIAAVIFWPITLLYFFCVSIVPLLFKAMIVVFSCIVYFASENPGVSISLGVIALIFFSLSENKSKAAHQMKNKPKENDTISDLAKPEILSIPSTKKEIIHPELFVCKSLKNDLKEKNHILKNEIAQKVLFLFLKAPSKRCLFYPEFSKMRPIFLKESHTQAVSYSLTRELRPLSITHEFGFSEEQKNEIHHFHVSEDAKLKFSFKLKHIVDFSTGDLSFEEIQIESYEGGGWETSILKKFKNIKTEDNFFGIKRKIVFSTSFFEDVLLPEESFISGMDQSIQLLKNLDTTDRNKLLKNLAHRNPTLARELEKSVNC